MEGLFTVTRLGSGQAVVRDRDPGQGLGAGSVSALSDHRLPVQEMLFRSCKTSWGLGLFQNRCPFIQPSLIQCLGNNERCQAGGQRQDSGQDSQASGLKEPMSQQWMEMIHKLRPDYDTSFQGNELDTMSRIKKGQEEGGQGGLLGGGDVQADPRMRRTWLCDDVWDGVGGSRQGEQRQPNSRIGEDLGCSRT